MAKQTMGEFIATLRKAKGYTQQQVADALGVSNKTVSVWETDRAYPDIMTLPALAELLGVTVDELLKGERSLENGEVTPDISEKSRKDILKRKLLGVSLKNTVLLCTGLALVLIFTVAVLLTAFAGLPKWAIILFFVMCLLGVVTVYIL